MRDFFRRLFRQPAPAQPEAPTAATGPQHATTTTSAPAPAAPMPSIRAPGFFPGMIEEELGNEEWEDEEGEADDDEKPESEVVSGDVWAQSSEDRTDFGAELWGVSSRQRSAGMDAERLRRFHLPLLASEKDVADWLGIPLRRLRWYTFDRAADTIWHYTRRVVPKRSGGERVLLAPKRDLKVLQRKVLDGVIAQVPVAPSVHGFVRGRSIVTNARQHAGKQVVLTLDLKDFFPSVTYPRVRGQFIALGYSFAVASALALLCTEYDREEFAREGKRYFISIGPRHLVQGAPTSPALANLVAWKLDKRLGGLAAKRGFIYTRYADDLTFSGDDVEGVQRLRVVASRIIYDEHFTPNKAKTRVARQSARQIVTGLVVNDAPATPRRLRRRLRAILHNARQGGLAGQNRDKRPAFRSYLEGMIAFVHSVNPRHAAPLRAQLDAIPPRE